MQIHFKVSVTAKTEFSKVNQSHNQIKFIKIVMNLYSNQILFKNNKKVVITVQNALQGTLTFHTPQAATAKEISLHFLMFI